MRDDGLFVATGVRAVRERQQRAECLLCRVPRRADGAAQRDEQDLLLAGDQDCRVSEVIGLDTVKDLPGGVYHHTPELAAQAAKAWADYQAQIAGAQPFVLARGGAPGLAVADPVGKSIDEKHAFQVQASYDADNLYFHYTVTSPSPLLNAIVNPQTIFKGGNLLDIQLAADPAADAKRTKPVPGDVRLLISRRDGKPWAVLMRPKVAGFTGQPIKLASPRQQRRVRRHRRHRPRGTARLSPDRRRLHRHRRGAARPAGAYRLKPGDACRLDVGYIFGNAGGTGTALRAYWHNNSFTANVVNDIPFESRLEPAEWGEARVE